MGIDIDRVFAGMFFVGSVLAGTAGMIAAGLLTIRPGADTDILLFALVVVIVGGLGSIGGAALGSVLIGLIDAFSRVWLPELSYFAVFAPMAIILVAATPGPVRAGDVTGRHRRELAIGCRRDRCARSRLAFVLPSYLVTLLSLVFIAALLASSVDLLAGQAGLVSIGHAGIAASAAYAIAWGTDNAVGLPA